MTKVSYAAYLLSYCHNSKDNMSSFYLTLETGVSYGPVNCSIMIRVGLKKENLRSFVNNLQLIRLVLWCSQSLQPSAISGLHLTLLRNTLCKVGTAAAFS